MWYALMPRACPSIETAPPTRTPTLTGSSPVRIGFASIDDRAGLLATARISRWVCRWSLRALATLAPHHLQLAWLHQNSDPSGPSAMRSPPAARRACAAVTSPARPAAPANTPPHWRTPARAGGPAVWPPNTPSAVGSPGGAGRSPAGVAARAGQAGHAPWLGAPQARRRCWCLATVGSSPDRSNRPEGMGSPAPRLVQQAADRWWCADGRRRSPGGVRG